MREIMRSIDNRSFLGILLEKEVMVRGISATGMNVQAALVEVRRQIAQAAASDFIKGAGVTKSDEDKLKQR